MYRLGLELISSLANIDESRGTLPCARWLVTSAPVVSAQDPGQHVSPVIQKKKRPSEPLVALS
jgi:hypothetical protein